MRKIILATIALITSAAPSFAQPGSQPDGGGGGEAQIKSIIAHMKFNQMAGVPRIAVLNGTDAVIESVTCYYSKSKTYVFAGDGVDSSVPENIGHIPSGKGEIANTKGWDSYCPNGEIAHLDSGEEVKGETDKPNDFTGSKWVIFWQHNVSK